MSFVQGRDPHGLVPWVNKIEIKAARRAFLSIFAPTDTRSVGSPERPPRAFLNLCSHRHKVGGERRAHAARFSQSLLPPTQGRWGAQSARRALFSIFAPTDTRSVGSAERTPRAFLNLCSHRHKVGGERRAHAARFSQSLLPPTQGRWGAQNARRALFSIFAPTDTRSVGSAERTPHAFLNLCSHRHKVGGERRAPAARFSQSLLPPTQGRWGAQSARRTLFSIFAPTDTRSVGSAERVQRPPRPCAVGE